MILLTATVFESGPRPTLIEKIGHIRTKNVHTFLFRNKFSKVMNSPGPGSCHENVPAPKALSSDLPLTDGLTVLARIEIVAILVHYQPSYNTSHTQ